MQDDNDLSFLDVTDLSTLSETEMDRRNKYWASRTANERLQELQRLNIAKWGEKAFGPMKKTLVWVQFAGTPEETCKVIFEEKEDRKDLE